MPDGRISQVRFEALASRRGAFPFASRLKRWFAYAPTANRQLVSLPRSCNSLVMSEMGMLQQQIPSQLPVQQAGTGSGLRVVE